MMRDKMSVPASHSLLVVRAGGKRVQAAEIRRHSAKPMARSKWATQSYLNSLVLFSTDSVPSLCMLPNALMPNIGL